MKENIEWTMAVGSSSEIIVNWLSVERIEAWFEL